MTGTNVPRNQNQPTGKYPRLRKITTSAVTLINTSADRIHCHAGSAAYSMRIERQPRRPDRFPQIRPIGHDCILDSDAERKLLKGALRQLAAPLA